MRVCHSLRIKNNNCCSELSKDWEQRRVIFVQFAVCREILVFVHISNSSFSFMKVPLKGIKNVKFPLYQSTSGNIVFFRGFNKLSDVHSILRVLEKFTCSFFFSPGGGIVANDEFNKTGECEKSSISVFQKAALSIDKLY